ncbi:MAG: hypothetical protein LBM27_03830 [Lactobacillaceae bacterium]|jgi:hypothetical protein|nr:hypothetical protein [Lactobacillaceae bacterium]
MIIKPIRIKIPIPRNVFSILPKMEFAVELVFYFIDEDKSLFLDLLNKARMESGLSQAAISRLINIDKGQFGRVLKGKRGSGELTKYAVVGIAVLANWDVDQIQEILGLIGESLSGSNDKDLLILQVQSECQLDGEQLYYTINQELKNHGFLQLVQQK